MSRRALARAQLLLAALLSFVPVGLGSSSCSSGATCESYCALAADCPLSNGLSGAGCSEVCGAAEEIAASTDCERELERHLECVSDVTDVCGPTTCRESADAYNACLGSFYCHKHDYPPGCQLVCTFGGSVAAGSAPELCNVVAHCAPTGLFTMRCQGEECICSEGENEEITHMIPIQDDFCQGELGEWVAVASAACGGWPVQPP